jgi:hypothetical protein
MAQTGPKFERGKAVSSRNAEMHGIFSNTPVLDIEDPAEWDAHLQGVLDSLEPEGHLETTIAHRVATLLWRMARVVRYETEMISIGMDYDPDHETIEILTGKTFDKATNRFRIPERERRIHIAARLIPGEMTGPMIMRYEATSTVNGYRPSTSSKPSRSAATAAPRPWLASTSPPPPAAKPVPPRPPQRERGRG